MSYDYMFFRVKLTVRSPAEITEENIEAIGTFDEIKSGLTAAFPKAKWWGNSGWLDPDVPMGCFDLADRATAIRCFSLSRVDVDEVKLVCRALGVVAFDGQKMSLIWP